jgi:epoxide hydrolase-like predicted phosphatase
LVVYAAYDRVVTDVPGSTELPGLAQPPGLTEPSGPAQPPGSGQLPELRAVITDWGGVLTQPIRDMVRHWIEADQIDWDIYLAVITPWLATAYTSTRDTETTGIATADYNPIHALERGECTVAEFERTLAARLVRTDGKAVIAEGLLTRMLAAGRPVPAMYELVRGLRRKGLRTALLSNSWGPSGYAREDFPELFDAVVISAEVGMRKPELRIFRHAAQELGVPPETCVFIDDVEANVDAAISCGMTGIHHTDPAATVARLTELFANR